MPLRYPNKGERKLRYISTSSSPIIGQGMLPGALTLSHHLLSLCVSRAKENPWVKVKVRVIGYCQHVTGIVNAEGM